MWCSRNQDIEMPIHAAKSDIHIVSETVSSRAVKT